MNNMLFPIRIYKINGIDARIGGEWPGKLPCHFKSFKSISKPPNNNIFSQVNNAKVIERPKKKQIIKSSSKEFVFCSCSKSLIPIQKIEKSQSLRIFPKSYKGNLNIFEDKKENIISKPANSVSKKTRLSYNVSLTKGELNEIISEELRLMSQHDKLQRVFKEISNQDLLKGMKRGDSINPEFKSQYHLESKSLDNYIIKDIDMYNNKVTKLFDSRLPKLINTKK